MKQYKQVSVYTEYAENSIEHIGTITGVDAVTLEEAAESARSSIISNIRNHYNYSEDVEPFIEEFYNIPITFTSNTAVVPEGETHITLVLTDSNPWYKVVDTDQSTWTYEKVQEWNEFVNSFNV